LTSLAAGCANTGVQHAELPAATPKPADRPPAGQARLTLTRVSGILYAGAPASAKVNGQKVADLWAGSSSAVAIAAGANTVTVEAWSYPGTWTVNLDARPGQTYAIEISPRGDSYVPGLFGPLGAAVDAANNKNAGAFQMRVVSQ